MMKNKLLNILLINTFVLFFFNFAHPVTPEMLQDKNMSDSINGIMYSCMSLGMVIGSPYFGKKIDNMKLNVIMIISLVGYGAAQQIFGFGNTVFIMAIGRILSGIFAGGWMVVSLQYINQNTTQDNKTKFFAYIMVSNAIAAIFGQILAGFLGTKLEYHIIFIIQFIGLIAISFLVIPLKSDVVNKNKKSKEQKLSIINIKPIIFPLILMFLFSLGFTAINSQIGYFFSSVLNKGTLFVGFVNSYVNIITLVINLFLINALYKRLKSPNIFLFNATITTLGIVLLLVFNVNILIAMTFILLGLVAYKPVLQKIILEDNSLKPGLSLGYLNSASSLGMVLGGTISGLLYANSPTYVIYLLLVIMILIFLMSLSYRK